MSGETVFWLTIALTGVAGSALFSGMETAAYGLNTVRLHVLSRTGVGPAATRARRLLRELEPPDRLLASLLIGNNVTNYLGALGVSALLSRRGLSDGGIVVVNALVLTPLLFVFGETLPKDLFRASADRVMPRLVPVLTVMRWGLTVTLALPVVRLVGAGLSRLLGITEPSAVTTARARLLTLLKEGMKHGVLSDAQADLVERANLLSERPVSEVMTPWSRVVTLGLDWPRARVQRTLRRGGHRTYPVVDRRGRALGVVRAARVWLEPETPLTSLVDTVPALEPEQRLADALVALRKAGARRAIVTTGGAPVGLVAERDLLSPLLGRTERR